MAMERFQSGQVWRPPTAADQQTTADVGDEYRSRRELGTPPQRLPVTRTTDIIEVKNMTGAARKFGDLVEVGASLLTVADRRNLVFEGNTPNDGERWAVLRNSAREDAIITAQIAGIAQARVYVSDATHKGATPVKGEPILQSSDFGPFRLWWNPAGETGEQDCIVMLDSPSGTIIARSPSGGIAAREGATVGSAICKLYTIDNSDQIVAMSNASGVAISLPVKNMWMTSISRNSYIACSVETSGDLIAWCPCDIETGTGTGTTGTGTGSTGTGSTGTGSTGTGSTGTGSTGTGSTGTSTSTATASSTSSFSTAGTNYPDCNNVEWRWNGYDWYPWGTCCEGWELDLTTKPATPPPTPMSPAPAGCVEVL